MNSKNYNRLHKCHLEELTPVRLLGLPINEFSRARIDITVNELKEEKAMVGELLGGNKE